MGLDSLNLTVAITLGLASIVSYLIYVKWSRKFRSLPKLLEDPNIKYQVKLIEKEQLSHDTRRFRFVLPSSEHVLGLPTGQHIYLSANINDQLIIRPYTPVSSDDDFGYFDLVVKVYFRNTNPRFPDGGKMSQHLENMSIGDSIQVRGPSGNLIYEGSGQFAIRKSKTTPPTHSIYTKVGMIAGGTGITPMLQVVKAVVKNPQDTTKLWLLFANQTEDDILLREELEKVEKEHPDRFKLWYTVDRSSPGWNHSVGFISAEMIEAHLPAPADDTLIVLCGPPPMINFACNPNLDKLGYSQQNRFAF